MPTPNICLKLDLANLGFQMKKSKQLSKILSRINPRRFDSLGSLINFFPALPKQAKPFFYAKITRIPPLLFEEGAGEVILNF